MATRTSAKKPLTSLEIGRTSRSGQRDGREGDEQDFDWAKPLMHQRILAYLFRQPNRRLCLSDNRENWSLRRDEFLCSIFQNVGRDSSPVNSRAPWSMTSKQESGFHVLFWLNFPRTIIFFVKCLRLGEIFSFLIRVVIRARRHSALFPDHCFFVVLL